MQQNLIKTTNLPITSAAFCQLGTAVLRRGFSLRFQAQGVSMQPLVRSGDALLIKPVDPGEIRLADIILVTRPNQPIVMHRVINCYRKSHALKFLIQGDRVSKPDGWVHPSQVIGRLALIQRDGKILSMDHPVMVLLGWLTARFSLWQLGRTTWTQTAFRILKRLPPFRFYLS